MDKSLQRMAQRHKAIAEWSVAPPTNFLSAWKQAITLLNRPELFGSKSLEEVGRA